MRTSLLLLIVALAGCTKKPPQTRGPLVNRVSFDGNGGLFSGRSNPALRNVMAHPMPKGFWPLRKRPLLDQGTLSEDEARLAVHYLHQGYPDGRLVRWEVVEKRPRKDDRPARVVVKGVIDEGSPVMLTTAELQGDLSGVEDSVAADVDASLPVTGVVFTLSDHELAVDEMKYALRNGGYAQADVRGKVKIDRDAGEVATTYTTEPGLLSAFGAITLPDQLPIPEKYLRDELPMKSGERFNLEDLEKTRKRFYNTRLFSLVQVKTEMTPGDPVVPVQLTLEERKPRLIGGGVGIELANGRQRALARFSFEHLNIAHRWLQFRFEVKGGYAVVGSALGNLSLAGVRHGPVVKSEVGLRIPGLGPRAWGVDLQASYEHELFEAYITDTPGLSARYSGPLSDAFSLSFGYRLTYARYSDLQFDPEDLANRADLQDLIDGQYFVTELEQSLTFDVRDDPLSPRKGMFHKLDLTEASAYLGGNYDYLGAQIDLRAYQNLRFIGRKSTVVAVRAGGGILVPYGPNADRGVPVAERLYLGGAESVRGFVYQHLGPYSCSVDTGPCNSETDPANKGDDVVPNGGLVSANATLEIRQYGPVIGGALFSDWGLNRASLQSTDRLITPTVGVGLRVFTPAGPVRLDLAARTDTVDRYRHEPRVWLHLGLGEAF